MSEAVTIEQPSQATLGLFDESFKQRFQRIMDNLIEAERSNARFKRSDELLADFAPSPLDERYSFAKDWHFAIGEWFKANLDIIWSTYHVDKKAYKKWTQGIRFRFEPGQTFYDAQHPYFQPWGEAILHVETCLQIVDANDGAITFEVFKTDHDAGQLAKVKRTTTTPIKFVKILTFGYRAALSQTAK